MAVMIYDFLKEIEEAEVRDVSLFAEPVKYDPVEIDLVDVKSDRVIGDTYERFAFKRVMRNRDERIYANKIDYLMDTNEASDVFSGHNKYQTVLFIVIIIFVIMLKACLFGKFLGLNSHFQKILATVNKITASIKTLVPISLLTATQAATITNDDTELHTDYYEIFMYMIQIMVITVIFSAIVWICTQIWNCINTRNLGRLHEKLNFMQFLYADKTEIHFQFMSNYMTWSVYLGSVHGNPEGIEMIGQFVNGYVTLFEGCVLDFLTIQWDNVNLSQHGLDLWLPPSLLVSLISKFFLRKMFERPNTLFRIIAHSPQNGKVRALTPLYKLIEEVVSSDIRTHQLQIAFSNPDEQQLYYECHPKIEDSVCNSADDVPELVFVPELTPEEKEAQQHKANQDFEQATEVAIQQLLSDNYALKGRQASPSKLYNSNCN